MGFASRRFAHSFPRSLLGPISVPRGHQLGAASPKRVLSMAMPLSSVCRHLHPPQPRPSHPTPHPIPSHPHPAPPLPTPIPLHSITWHHITSHHMTSHHITHTHPAPSTPTPSTTPPHPNPSSTCRRRRRVISLEHGRTAAVAASASSDCSFQGGAGLYVCSGLWDPCLQAYS